MTNEAAGITRCGWRHLSRIIERVERGEEIIIDRAGTPVAKVVSLD
jgi:prevent-host-death family protein